MRISDWSSDVCSSDLYPDFPGWNNEEPDLPAAQADRSYLPVEVLPSFAGMGGGGTGEGDRETALISRTLIEDDLRAKPADLLLIDVRGDSMMPDFLHGDQILVDKRSEEHTSELKSLMRISYAIFCLNTKIKKHTT